MEEIAKKIEMWIYAKIGFAYIDENGQMDDPIGIQMDKPNLVIIKEFAQKRMRR